MVELAQGRRVLNIGCCGSDALTSTDTVHSRLAGASSYCLGVDVFEEGIRKMQADGENVVLGDAERLDLDAAFDLVVLGDVIEHVSNPGLVFDAASRHLVHGGIVAVTTPNPFSLPLMLRRLGLGSSPVNSEHVCWFDPVLLSFLLKRSGFEVAELLWTEASQYRPLRWLQHWRPYFHSTFGVIAKKIG
jgi:2-polyprenyl-3-methyl-5-hydroxy-6-metoxy-1,4-benzoquinol methylase